MQRRRYAVVLAAITTTGLMTIATGLSLAEVAPVVQGELTRPRFVAGKLSAAKGDANRQYTFTGVITKSVSVCNVHTECPGVELQLPLSELTPNSPTWVSGTGGALPVTPTAVFKAGVATASIGGNDTYVADAWVDVFRAGDQPEKLYLHVLVKAIPPIGVSEANVTIPYQATVLATLVGGTTNR